MDVKRRLTFDAVLVIGTVGSVALGIVFFIWDGREDVGWAAVAGLLGMIITVQVEIMLRDKHRAEFESRMGALVARLERFPWLGDVVDRMTTSMANVEDAYGTTPAVRFGKQVLQEAEGKLAELEFGHFRLPWDDNSIVMDLVRNLDHEMLAISAPTIDLKWWLTPEGRQYWKLQQEVLRRGKQIRRIFIYDTWTDEVEKLAREQKDAGVKVGKVSHDKLPGYLVGVTNVWDDKVAIELEYSATGEAMKFSFLVAPPDIERIKRQYEHIERLAEGLDGEVDITE